MNPDFEYNSDRPYEDDLESNCSSATDSTVDDEYIDDNDPRLSIVWEEIWEGPPIRFPIARYLKSDLTSLATNNKYKTETRGALEDFILKTTSKENSVLFKMKCARLRQFEKMMEPPKEKSYGFSKIVFVTDLKNIVLEKAPCKYGDHCFKEYCPFSHPPRQQVKQTNWYQKKRFVNNDQKFQPHQSFFRPREEIKPHPESQLRSKHASEMRQPHESFLRQPQESFLRQPQESFLRQPQESFLRQPQESFLRQPESFLRQRQPSTNNWVTAGQKDSGRQRQHQSFLKK